MSIGVHVTHCCVVHGCKYGDPDCPVELKTHEQEYPCEDCDFMWYKKFKFSDQNLAKASEWWSTLTEKEKMIIWNDYQEVPNDPT